MKRLLNLPIDWFLLIIPIIITVTGIVTIYTITYQEHGFRLVIDQLIFALLGLAVLGYFMFSDYRLLNNHAYLIYLAAIVLLLPLLPIVAPYLGFVPKVFGAHRWLDFGIFQFQPSEVVKVVAAIIAAKIFANNFGEMKIKKILNFSLLAIIPIALVRLQPDLGTSAIITFVFFTVFIAARPPWRILSVIILSLLVIGALVFSNLQTYQKQRINTFLNPASDPLGEGYNVIQSIIAVGSGGLTGRGFGQGSQTVLNFLPVPHADFIYAGYAEATGFTGSTLLIILYVALLFRAFAVARDSTDKFGQLLAVGIAGKFFIQIFVHVGMNIGLLPVTGIPLPFMSYGGTALITDLALIGILQAIAIRHKRIVFR